MAEEVGTSPVPFGEWITAFRIANAAIAKAYKAVVKPKIGLRAFGAAFRIALNKVFLPRLREALAANPKLETPAEIYDFMLRVLEEVAADPNLDAIVRTKAEEMKLHTYLGVDIDKFVELFKTALSDVIKYLREHKEEILASLGYAAKAAA